MDAPFGIERELQLAGHVVLRRGFESGNQPAFVLDEGIHLQIGAGLPQQMRAGVSLCSAPGQEQRTRLNVAIA